MSIDTCIIADDFTGAGDAGIHFRKAGCSVYMPLKLDKETIPENLDVLVINSESRLADSSAACSIVAEIVMACRELGVRTFYKKIDSTLRGNLSEEIRSVMVHAEYDAALICPAAPMNNRFVIKGVCYIGSVPIDQTETGRDELTPVVSPKVEDHFSKGERISHIGFEDIEKGSDHLLEMIDDHIREGVSHFICDTGCLAHLEILADLQQDTRLLMVGSSGLADAISTRIASCPMDLELDALSTNQVLVVSGSRMRISQKQLDYLARERDFSQFRLSVRSILEEDEEGLAVFFKELESHERGRSLILNPENSFDFEEAKDRMKENSGIIADFIGTAVKRILEMQDIAVLVTVGGHTTYRTMKKIDAQGVSYLGEVAPGTPVGILHFSSDRKNLILVTKSGSFGDEGTLVSIIDFIKQERGVTL